MKSITLHKSQGCHEKLKDLLFFYFNKWLNSLIKERKDRTINKINLYINSLLMSAINMLFWVPQSIEICLPWFQLPGLMDQTKRKPCHPWCNIQDLTHLYLVYRPVTILTILTKKLPYIQNAYIDRQYNFYSTAENAKQYGNILVMWTDSNTEKEIRKTVKPWFWTSCQIHLLYNGPL